MIKYHELTVGQKLVVRGPDETGQIPRNITVTVFLVQPETVTVKDDKGRQWKFHYAHGAEQLETVKPDQPQLRQNRPTLNEWLARGNKAEDYPESDLGPLVPDRPTLEQWVAAGNRAEDYPQIYAQPQLRQDGPTLNEYVASGYKAGDYPPEGYAARPEDGGRKTEVGGQSQPQQRSGWFGLGKRPGSASSGPPAGSME
jgi:hypothetical protein